MTALAQQLPAFTKLAFCAVNVAGTTLAATAPIRLVRATSGGVVQVATGSITPAGTGFALTFMHS